MVRRWTMLVALLAGTLAASLPARATLRIADIDMHGNSIPGGRRAPYPAKKVNVGDRVEIDALLFHDVDVRDWSTAWTTTAPVTGVTQWSSQRGVLTGVQTHLIGVGGATFTAAGRYKLDVKVHSGAGDVTGSFDIEVDEIRAVVPPLQAACLAPSVRWISPTANGQICLGKDATLMVSPTFHGCEPHTVQIMVPTKGGPWEVLGTKTAAPWTFTHKFTGGGTVHLKAVVKDKNGATGEAEITATVSECLDASKFRH